MFRPSGGILFLGQSMAAISKFAPSGLILFLPRFFSVPFLSAPDYFTIPNGHLHVDVLNLLNWNIDWVMA